MNSGILSNIIFRGKNPDLKYPYGKNGILCYLDNVSLINLASTSRYNYSLFKDVICLRGRFLEENRILFLEENKHDFIEKKESWLKKRIDISDEDRIELDNKFKKQFKNYEISLNQVDKLKELYERGASSNIFSGDYCHSDNISCFLRCYRRGISVTDAEIIYEITKIVIDSETDREHLYNQEAQLTEKENIIQQSHVFCFNSFGYCFSLLGGFPKHVSELGLKIFRLLYNYDIGTHIYDILYKTYGIYQYCEGIELSNDREILKLQVEYLKIFKTLIKNFPQSNFFNSNSETNQNSYYHKEANREQSYLLNVLFILMKYDYDWESFAKEVIKKYNEYIFIDPFFKNEYSISCLKKFLLMEETPLHFISISTFKLLDHWYYNVIKFLISRNKDRFLNIVEEKSGNNLLLKCLISNFNDDNFINFLIDKEINTNIINKDGLNCLDLLNEFLNTNIK